MSKIPVDVPVEKVIFLSPGSNVTLEITSSSYGTLTLSYDPIRMNDRILGVVDGSKSFSLNYGECSGD